MHQRAIRILLVSLAGYLARHAVGEIIPSPSDVELEPESVTQPDLLVVPAAEAQRVMRDGLPIHELLLAIEVLSASSGRHDRVRKRLRYQRHVPHYWIVDLDARLIERCSPGEDRPQVITDVLEWRPAGVAESYTRNVAPFFAEVFGEA